MVEILEGGITPECSRLRRQHEILDSSKEQRKSFYKMAEDRISYLNTQEIKEWIEESIGASVAHGGIAYAYTGYRDARDKAISDSPRRWVTHLEIVVNEELFKDEEEDFSDILPFVLEHELYEAWLGMKKGAGEKLTSKDHHLLARRRECLLAETNGLGDRLLAFYKKNGKKADILEVESALSKARKKLRQ